MTIASEAFWLGATAVVAVATWGLRRVRGPISRAIGLLVGLVVGGALGWVASRWHLGGANATGVGLILGGLVGVVCSLPPPREWFAEPLTVPQAISLIGWGLFGWGAFLALGALVNNENPRTALLRPAIVVGSVGIFLGFWRLMLTLHRPRRNDRRPRDEP